MLQKDFTTNYSDQCSLAAKNLTFGAKEHKRKNSKK